MQGSRVVCLAAGFAALVLGLLAAPQAEAMRTEYFGISQGRELGPLDRQKMADAHVRTVRFLLQWRAIQPTQGPYNWDQPDRVIGDLAAKGIRVLPFAWGSPEWVRPGPSRPPVSSEFAKQAWRNFLKAAVTRYGPNGTFWATRYKQDYPNGTPYPVQAWQVWNEPNLKKYFNPGQTTGSGIQQYALLVKVAHDAIASIDSQARVVLAGMLGNGDPLAWDFLKGLYQVPGFRSSFDIAALHPYTGYLDGFRRQILQFRVPMTNNGDSAKPLWLSEFGWGSAQPDEFGINKGLAGQAQMLRDSFDLLLDHRRAWNVQRIFWFMWRDPPPSQGTGGCSFCASAGLLTYQHAQKPAYGAFRSYTAEMDPPLAAITAGPGQGGFTRDTTPTFSFGSDEPGSTFVCRLDGGLFKPCSPPHTTAPLSNGTHTFFVKAIDAPGNESQTVFRSFTVDTVAPAAPRITDTDPNSPANDNAPEVKGTAAAGSTVRLFKTAGCPGGTVVAQGSSARFASPGITASVPNNTTTAFRARAVDAAGNVSACSAAFTYVEDSTP